MSDNNMMLTQVRCLVKPLSVILGQLFSNVPPADAAAIVSIVNEHDANTASESREEVLARVLTEIYQVLYLSQQAGSDAATWALLDHLQEMSVGRVCVADVGSRHESMSAHTDTSSASALLVTGCHTCGDVECACPPRSLLDAQFRQPGHGSGNSFEDDTRMFGGYIDMVGVANDESHSDEGADELVHANGGDLPHSRHVTSHRASKHSAAIQAHRKATTHTLFPLHATGLAEGKSVVASGMATLPPLGTMLLTHAADSSASNGVGGILRAATGELSEEYTRGASMNTGMQQTLLGAVPSSHSRTSTTTSTVTSPRGTSTAVTAVAATITSGTKPRPIITHNTTPGNTGTSGGVDAWGKHRDSRGVLTQARKQLGPQLSSLPMEAEGNTASRASNPPKAVRFNATAEKSGATGSATPKHKRATGTPISSTPLSKRASLSPSRALPPVLIHAQIGASEPSDTQQAAPHGQLEAVCGGLDAAVLIDVLARQWEGPVHTVVSGLREAALAHMGELSSQPLATWLTSVMTRYCTTHSTLLSDMVSLLSDLSEEVSTESQQLTAGDTEASDNKQSSLPSRTATLVPSAPAVSLQLHGTTHLSQIGMNTGAAGHGTAPPAPGSWQQLTTSFNTGDCAVFSHDLSLLPPSEHVAYLTFAHLSGACFHLDTPLDQRSNAATAASKTTTTAQTVSDRGPLAKRRRIADDSMPVDATGTVMMTDRVVTPGIRWIMPAGTEVGVQPFGVVARDDAPYNAATTKSTASTDGAHGGSAALACDGDTDMMGREVRSSVVSAQVQPSLIHGNAITSAARPGSRTTTHASTAGTGIHSHARVDGSSPDGTDGSGQLQVVRADASPFPSATHRGNIRYGGGTMVAWPAAQVEGNNSIPTHTQHM